MSVIMEVSALQKCLLREVPMYQYLGRVSVDSDFDDDWKGEVESKVEACGRMSGSCEDAF